MTTQNGFFEKYNVRFFSLEKISSHLIFQKPVSALLFSLDLRPLLRGLWPDQSMSSPPIFFRKSLPFRCPLRSRPGSPKNFSRRLSFLAPILFLPKPALTLFPMGSDYPLFPMKGSGGLEVASLSRKPRVGGSIPPLGTLGNVLENLFLGSTQAL